MITERKKYELFGKPLIEKITITAPFKVPSPMQDEACFLYVIEGEIKYQLNTQKINIPANDAVLLKCGNYFGQMRSNKNSKTQEVIIVHFHPEILKRIYEKEVPKILQQPDTINLTVNFEKINNEILIQKYIEGLLFYFDNPSLVNEEMLVLKLKEIILLLSQTKNALIIQQILSQLFSPATFNFKQVIEDNIYTHLSAEQLAQLCNLSTSSFKREFAKIYDDTPSNYLKNIRLDRAAELLLISNERIKNIASDCGFNTLAHFSKCFHQKFNVSPTTYRLNKIDK